MVKIQIEYVPIEIEPGIILTKEMVEYIVNEVIPLYVEIEIKEKE